MTPTVFQLAIVLLLSALATAPHLTPHWVGIIYGGLGLVCLAFSVRALVMFATRTVVAPHWSDFWAYGVGRFERCKALMESEEFERAIATLS